MAKCSLCGKGPSFGHNVSHANNKTKKKWKPNVQRVKALVAPGTVRRMSVCTACIKSGKVAKAL